jgi:hypothetical protein
MSFLDEFVEETESFEAGSIQSDDYFATAEDDAAAFGQKMLGGGSGIAVLRKRGDVVEFKNNHSIITMLLLCMLGLTDDLKQM